VLDGERDLLAAADYAGVRARLRVEDANGILVDLATMLGVDPFLSATWTESIDLSCAIGAITLNSLAGDTNLSPLMDASLANVAGPLLGVRRKFELSTAIGESGGWQRILVGIIDRVNVAAGEDTIQLAVRDMGGYLLNLWFEDEPDLSYSDPGGQPVESIMELMVTHAVGFPTGTIFVTPPIPVLCPVSPGWDIKQFAQLKEPVLEGLRKLALQIGWDLRYRNNSGDVPPSLYLVDPDRTRTTPDAIIGPSEYLDVRDLTINGDDIRNRIRGWYGASDRLSYFSGDTTDPVLAARLNISQQRYGPRFMQLVEERTSNIDTLTEISRMVDAAAADLSEPFAEQEIELRYWPLLQLNDRIRFLPNGVHYDQPQDWSVASYTHTLVQGEGQMPTTTIRTRGSAAAAYHDWFRGKDRMEHIYTVPPPVGPSAREGARWAVVADLAFP
jgi:hypothetical protein